MAKSKQLIILALIGIIAISCAEKKEPLKEYSGRVVEITNEILKVDDGSGSCITFDNRKVTYVGGTIMPKDSVCVTYRGDLNSGTPSIIAEFIPTPRAKIHVEARRDSI